MTVKTLHVPARDLPLPAHISEPARAFLASRPDLERPAYPALDDKEAWRRQVEVVDAMIAQQFPTDDSAFSRIAELREGEAKAWEIVPRDADPASRRVFLDVHGGALIYGGGKAACAMSMKMAGFVGARVIAADYRMAPDFPHPVPMDDCLAIYRMVLRDHAPHEIIVGGGSAGGNLAAAMLLKARDEGLPMPAACVLRSPELDLTESGDTFATNAGIDPMGSLMEINLLHADGHPLDHPYLSPLFGNFSKGFPPTFLNSGTRDLFLSNTIRMQWALRDAGIETELHVIEAGIHGAFGNSSPEDNKLDREIRRFCDKWWRANGC